MENGIWTCSRCCITTAIHTAELYSDDEAGETVSVSLHYVCFSSLSQSLCSFCAGQLSTVLWIRALGPPSVPTIILLWASTTPEMTFHCAKQVLHTTLAAFEVSEVTLEKMKALCGDDNNISANYIVLLVLLQIDRTSGSVLVRFLCCVTLRILTFRGSRRCL